MLIKDCMVTFCSLYTFLAFNNITNQKLATDFLLFPVLNDNYNNANALFLMSLQAHEDLALCINDIVILCVFFVALFL